MALQDFKKLQDLGGTVKPEFFKMLNEASGR